MSRVMSWDDGPREHNPYIRESWEPRRDPLEQFARNVEEALQTLGRRTQDAFENQSKAIHLLSIRIKELEDYIVELEEERELNAEKELGFIA